VHMQRAGERARQQHMGRKARGAQRTQNMRSMSVTREVSQLRSGWLNFFASCRGSQAERRCGAGCGPGETGGGVHACRREGATADIGWHRARREARTKNISFMSVTREVSQRSGWLKASAACRESKQDTYGARGELNSYSR